MAEQFGTLTSPNNFFEDFEVGRVIAHCRGKTVTEMDNVLLTNLVMNTADGHFNEDGMKRSAAKGVAGFDTRIVFGGVTLSLVIGLAAQDTGEQVVREVGMDKIRLRAPVKHGDTLYAITEVVSTGEGDQAETGLVRFKHYGINQNDTIVCEGERSVIIKRRPIVAMEKTCT